MNLLPIELREIIFNLCVPGVRIHISTPGYLLLFDYALIIVGNPGRAKLVADMCISLN